MDEPGIRTSSEDLRLCMPVLPPLEEEISLGRQLLGALDGVEEVPAQQEVEHEEGEEGERLPNVVHIVAPPPGELLSTLIVEMNSFIWS